jgi:hypothetical protein
MDSKITYREFEFVARALSAFSNRNKTLLELMNEFQESRPDFNVPGFMEALAETLHHEAIIDEADVALVYVLDSGFRAFTGRNYWITDLVHSVGVLFFTREMMSRNITGPVPVSILEAPVIEETDNANGKDESRKEEIEVVWRDPGTGAGGNIT